MQVARCRAQGVKGWHGVRRLGCVGLSSARPPELSQTDPSRARSKGITPILQVLRGIAHDSEDKTTQVHVLNANRTEADILMRAELDELEKLAGVARYKQHLVLSQGPDDWPFSRGRIGREHLERHLPPPADDALVLMCAPPAMQDMVSAHLAELGWDVPKQVVVF